MRLSDKELHLHVEVDPLRLLSKVNGPDVAQEAKRNLMREIDLNAPECAGCEGALVNVVKERSEYKNADIYRLRASCDWKLCPLEGTVANTDQKLSPSRWDVGIPDANATTPAFFDDVAAQRQAAFIKPDLAPRLNRDGPRMQWVEDDPQEDEGADTPQMYGSW